LAIWRDQRPWRLGWGELTDELTVGRQRAAARPSGQGILALPDRRAAVVLSPCALGHEFFSSAAAASYACRSARSMAHTFGRDISRDKSYETLV